MSAEPLEVARRYRAAFATYDPAAYAPLVAPEVVAYTGFAAHRGIEALHSTAAAARVLYPHDAPWRIERRALSQGAWAVQLVELEAVNNAEAFYDNVYAFWYEVVDGVIATHVEMLDFGVSSSKFDLCALASVPMVPGERRSPAQRASPPDDDDPSPAARATRAALGFLAAFSIFDESRYEPLLIADPQYRLGMLTRGGRAGFAEVARLGRQHFPNGIADREIHALVSDGGTVAALMTVHARTAGGGEYVNLHSVFLDIHDGRVASMVEILDARVAAEALGPSAS